MTGTVVLVVGAAVVAVVPAVVVGRPVGAAAVVLVVRGTVVVSSELAPAVLTGTVGVPIEGLGTVDVVATPEGPAPEPPGNAGPDELAAALDREWTGR